MTLAVAVSAPLFFTQTDGAPPPLPSWSPKKAKTDAGASGSKAKPPSGAAKPKPNREPSMGKSSPRRADPGARGKANLMELSQQQHQQQQQQQMNSTDSSGRVLEAALRKQFELQQMLAEQLEVTCPLPPPSSSSLPSEACCA